jgi:hypothetical protein
MGASPGPLRGRLYADGDFPLPAVEEPRGSGHDVVTMPEIGKAEQRAPDEDVLPLAVAGDRAVLTLDRKHFIRIHRERPAQGKSWRIRDSFGVGPSGYGLRRPIYFGGHMAETPRCVGLGPLRMGGRRVRSLGIVL